MHYKDQSPTSVYFVCTCNFYAWFPRHQTKLRMDIRFFMVSELEDCINKPSKPHIGFFNVQMLVEKPPYTDSKKLLRVHLIKHWNHVHVFFNYTSLCHTQFCTQLQQNRHRRLQVLVAHLFSLVATSGEPLPIPSPLDSGILLSLSIPEFGNTP